MKGGNPKIHPIYQRRVRGDLINIFVTVHRFQVSGFRGNAVTIKKCMDVACLEVYSKLCRLHKECFRILN